MNFPNNGTTLLKQLSFCMFIFYAGFVHAKAEKEPLPLDELRAFSEAYYQIKSSYVQPVDDVDLLRAAIRGMVGSLDRHSKYLSPQEFERFNTDNEGEYAGIGLSFNDHKYGIEVAEVVKNSPAARAGIKPGMIVTHIDQREIQFIPVMEAYTMLKGEVGSSVNLTVAAAEFAKPQDYDLQREIILLESITSQQLPDNTGYIAISQFTLNSVSEFVDAIKDLSKEHELEKLIIDLRDNPGGVMEVAVELSDLFIPKGKLLISNGRTDDSNQTYYAHTKAPLSNLKVVVVINNRSASASEILAAALKDHHKALIFGENSYGKGSIQSIVPLNHESGVKLTTAEYFSPLGNKIQDVGVKPDVEFEQTEGKNPYSVSLLDDPQLLQAYNLLSKKPVH
ncbi:S41 family peptidase [Aliikangiella coralliicola]|uniref:S41 family peptidase n=1 Tax=Aliikangiella coralliicola TaxID=2592383 RepID=A0A545UIB9_9GAMM|nr:S41 family peptidase [Aliikangiella coralliicola]TQV89209.1 S41 family peptidase [Aliikangiella coralliicola]